MMLRLMTRLSFALAFLAVARLASAQLPSFDFTQQAARQGWAAAHDLAPLGANADGLVTTITGADPYFHGPAMDLPDGQPLWLDLSLRADQSGLLQIFYFRTHPTEEDSLRIHVAGGQWEKLRIPFPALGKRYRLRIDPPGNGGQVVFRTLSFSPRIPLKQPQWPKLENHNIPDDAPSVRSGNVVLSHASDRLGSFRIESNGRTLAIGHDRALIGYIVNDQQRWIDLSQRATTKVARSGAGLVVTAEVRDEDGATWTISQRFAPAAEADAIDVDVSLSVNADRAVTFAPMLMLSAGPGWIGQSKTQAIFAGLEYLDKDEPSSSEADIIGPGSRRQVPDSLKITFPLMTVYGDGTYVGLIWEKSESISALFDSPDRIFSSGGHLMGLIYPGSNGSNREDGNLLPHWPQLLRANERITAKATIIIGQASSAVAAVQRYVKLRGLPKVPDPGMSLQQYVSLAAAGWMDSKIREGDRYRHAWPGAFNPHPSADAAMLMDWLAARCTDSALKMRLIETARAALAQVAPNQFNSASVSHVRFPVQSLLYGHVAENARMAQQHGRALLGRFEPDGSLLYRATPGGMDFGKTHFARDANGLTATNVAAILEAASISGDAKLIEDGLRVLRAMDKFMNTVPRGAQTWECPLHTPDILASAYLVKAYTLGYQLSGDAKLLESARYWAWTGLPFVYLTNPTDRPAGPYATIAVFGATVWKAPNWMGLPVQWCGLVYADSLYRLAQHDSSGPWRQVADGITASGIQQTWPIGSDPQRQGLLPDSFVLRSGQRNDAAINPGTVQANAVRLYRQPDIYTFQPFRNAGWFVHAPGAISDPRESPNSASFRISGCIKPEYYMLVSGCNSQPRIIVNGQAAAPHAVEYIADSGWLIVKLKGDANVQLSK